MYVYVEVLSVCLTPSLFGSGRSNIGLGYTVDKGALPCDVVEGHNKAEALAPLLSLFYLYHI